MITNHVEEARGMIIIGRALERRNLAYARFKRHTDYGNYMKVATGKRLPLQKLAA